MLIGINGSNRKFVVFTKRELLLILASFFFSLLVTLVAEGLVVLINFISNLCFYGEISIEHKSLTDNKLGAWVILVPIAGGLVVG